MEHTGSVGTFTDENGVLYRVDRSLGAGGQGEVFLVQGGHRIVKRITRGGDREALRRQLAFVKRLDLSGLHVARPIALLRPPHTGYVAEFLSDMVPIRLLLKPPSGTAMVPWYCAGGGLRRRLRLLAHAGEALAGLHARGLVYGDVSHNNIFISAQAEAHEAWLIDLDNLCTHSEPGRAVFTPYYGAPEIVTGRSGATSLSDAWAFAVLAFNALTLLHPLCGDLVRDGEPELEEQALTGQVPWIDHTTDSRNRASDGLPRELVLGSKLQDLACRTFEHSVAKPLARPGVEAWVERLHLAADQTVRCTSCAGTFLVSAAACPFCAVPRPTPILVRLQRWEPGRGVVAEMGVCAQLPLLEETLTLTRRHCHAEIGVNARRPVIALERRPRGVQVRVLDGPCWVTPPGKSAQDDALEVGSRGRIIPVGETADSWAVHFQPISTAHRVALISGGRP